MKITEHYQVWDLWEIYKAALWAYVFKRTQNKLITDDIIHEVLLKTYNSCCSDIEIKNVRSWLFQIAHNAMIDFYKKNQKNAEISNLNIKESETDIYKELSVFLNQLIDFLPPKYAIPLRLSDIGGMKQQDIASEIGLGLPATKSRIQRARKLLKEQVHDCFHVKECTSSGLVDFTLKDSCFSLQKSQREKK